MTNERIINMAIVNRTLDVSEQRKVFETKAGATATGITGIVCVVPWPSTLVEGQIVAFGLSGAPAVALAVNRFIAGTGFTSITIATGTSNLPPAYGTSGVGISGMILPAAGSTLLNLLANDVLLYVTSVANTAVTGLAVDVVLAPVQDIKVHFGMI